MRLLQAPWEAGFRLGDYSSIFRLNETTLALIYALQGNDTSMNGLSSHGPWESSSRRLLYPTRASSWV
jgi:hypothetical protein